MPKTTTTVGTVVGAFETELEAQAAVKALQCAGFSEEEIVFVAPSSESGFFGVRTGTKVGDNVVVGLLVGGAIGGLWGMGILARVVPGVGPAVVGGTLPALLSSVAAGAAVISVVGALIGMGIPVKDADHANPEYGKGRSIVSVRGNRANEGRAILDANGAVRRL